MKFRKKKIRKNTIPYSDNIIILCLDSISRNNVLRKLKKTMKFFEKFISYKGGHNKKYPDDNFHSFQFLKYHRFRGFTETNFPPLFYGNTVKENDFVRITKYLKENGYTIKLRSLPRGFTCMTTTIIERIIFSKSSEAIFSSFLFINLSSNSVFN